MKKRFIGIVLAGALLAFGPSLSAQETAVETPGRTGFFLQAQGGLSFFLKNTLDVQREFNLYGETGSLAESYTFGPAVPIDVSVGRYFRLGGGRLKAGLGFGNLFRKDTGNFTSVIPHPFLFNAPRTVAFAADSVPNKSMSFYAYGLFSLVDNATVGLWLGPIIGLGLEKINTLNDFAVNEKAPYAAADVTISDLAYTEDSFASLWYGACLEFEYALSETFGLVVSGRLIYDNPQISNVGHRANFLQLQAALGFRVII